MKDIVHQLGRLWGGSVKNITASPGGDINEAYKIDTDEGRFFIKLNDARRYPGMMAAEAAGLDALQKHFLLKVPAVIATGEVAGRQYLVLEWLTPVTHTPATEMAFGYALAQMHRTTYTAFGWHRASYIGTIAQSNGWWPTWPELYAETRLLPLVKNLRDKGAFSAADVQQVEAFCQRLPHYLPTEPPALLHGDLWSGNTMAVVAAGGRTTTAIYDPSVYYGHREMDLAMTRLFGGFSPLFYAAYEEVYPLQSGWQQRLLFFQLYPLLVHAVLFGGSYVSRARAIVMNHYRES